MEGAFRVHQLSIRDLMATASLSKWRLTLLLANPLSLCVAHGSHVESTQPPEGQKDKKKKRVQVEHRRAQTSTEDDKQRRVMFENNVVVFFQWLCPARMIDGVAIWPVHVVHAIRRKEEALDLGVASFERTGEQTDAQVRHPRTHIAVFSSLTYYFFRHSLARSILNSGRLTKPSAFSSWHTRDDSEWEWEEDSDA